MTLVERYQYEKNPQQCSRVCGTSCWEARSLEHDRDRKDFEPCEYCNVLEMMRRLEQTKKDEERQQRQQQKVLVVKTRIQRPTTPSAYNNGFFPVNGEYISSSPVSMAHSFSPVSQHSTSPINTPHLPKLKPSSVRAGYVAGQGPLADAALLAKMKWVAEMKKTSPELTKIMPEPVQESQISTATASPAPNSWNGSNILSPNASTVNLFPIIPQPVAGSSPSTHNNSLTSSPSDPRLRKTNNKPVKTINTNNTTIHTPVIAPDNLVATYYAQAFSPITLPTTTNSYTLPPDYLDHSFNSTTDGSMDSLNQLSDLSNAPPSSSLNMMLIQRPISNIQSMNMMIVQKQPISKRPQTATSSSTRLLQRRPNTASPTRTYQRPSSTSAIRFFQKSR